MIANYQWPIKIGAIFRKQVSCAVSIRSLTGILMSILIVYFERFFCHCLLGSTASAGLKHCTDVFIFSS